MVNSCIYILLIGRSNLNDVYYTFYKKKAGSADVHFQNDQETGFVVVSENLPIFLEQLFYHQKQKSMTSQRSNIFVKSGVGRVHSRKGIAHLYWPS